MLDRKTDNITKVMLSSHDNTINQSVTPEVMSMTDCGEWKMSVISRNYLITGFYGLNTSNFTSNMRNAFRYP